MVIAGAKVAWFAGAVCWMRGGKLHCRFSRAFLCCVLAWNMLAVMAGAAGTNAVPSVESFEDYADGFAIDGAQGWSIGEDAEEGRGCVTTNAAAVSALTNYIAGGGSPPLNTTHDQVLSLGASVSLSVDSPAAEPVRTDFMLKPYFAEEQPELDGEHQAGLLFNTNGQAEIFHRNAGAGTNEWITLTNSPTIASGAWVRVTFYQDYTNHMYQVCLDDGAPIKDSLGYDSPGGSQPGSWFLMPNGRGHMSSLNFDGDGEAYLDDVIVGGLLPLVDTLVATNVTTTSADLNGFLSYTGSSPTTVLVYWGDNDGGTTASAWDATNTLAAPQPPGALSSPVSGLTSDTIYFYRYAAANAAGTRWANTTELFLAGEVTISSTDQVALESPPEAGNVIFSRPAGATNVDLTVHYTLSGPAENGVDYQPLSGAATIPEGQAHVTVTVMPLRDGLVEGQEVATVTVEPVGYAVGSPDNVMIFIQDVEPGSTTLVWDNGSGDRNWNYSSSNWIPDVTFVDTDPVEFLGISTGRIYVGEAMYTGSDFESQSPGAVSPASIKVSGGAYEFEGGHVAGGTALVETGGRLVDRNLGNSSFGNGAVTLDGGEFWRQIPPGTTTRTHRFVNDIVVNARSLLNGNRGNNYWDGGLELRDRLNLNYETTESYAFVHYFGGPVTINQDTNHPNDRVLYVQGRDGATRITGPVVDSTNATHTGEFPLVIGSRKVSGSVRAGEIYLEGSNTYSHGTVIAYWETEGNDERGVTVEPGSSLGTGWVTVEGTNAPTRTGAVLTLNAEEAIDDKAVLSLYGGGKIVLNVTGEDEEVDALFVDGADAGWGFFDSSDYPWNISGAGRLFVPPPWAESTLLIVR
jgi:hypothetical protein